MKIEEKTHSIKNKINEFDKKIIKLLSENPFDFTEHFQRR